jgi:regulator of sigma E protease
MEEQNKMTQRQMVERRLKRVGKFFKFVFLAALLVAGLSLLTNLRVLVNIVIVGLGFGAVIMIHEFGHFIVCRMCGIKVEAFSIGFPPTLISWQKSGKGFKVRFLPSGGESKKNTNSADSDDQDNSDSLTNKAISNMTESEEQTAQDEAGTEYRLGLLPFGGFVKPLGQEDVGEVDKSEDPASFANKPVWKRIAVVGAGVTFNAISAVIIFMLVFSMGLNLPGTTVGGVTQDSPAAQAGLEPGDEIVSIEGEDFIEFTSLVLAAATSEQGEPVEMTVEKVDGRKDKITVVSEISPRSALPIRSFGISPELNLKITPFKNPETNKEVFSEIPFEPGDRIVACQGQEIEHSWELMSLVDSTVAPNVSMTVMRKDNGSEKRAQFDVPLNFPPSGENFKTEFDLQHICSMTPRLKVTSTASTLNDELEIGDIIVKAASVRTPNYHELREITTEYKDKDLPLSIMRYDEQDNGKRIDLTVRPYEVPGSEPERVNIGIGVELDMEHAIVADTVVTENGPEPLMIPRGALIERVDGYEVDSFYDIARRVREAKGRRITIEYRVLEQPEIAGPVVVNIPDNDNYVDMRGSFAIAVPLEPQKELYKASNPLEAVGMGLKKAQLIAVNSLVTLKRLVQGQVSTKGLSGPVGILTMSYTMVSEQPIIYYVYLLGIISTALVIFNLLPIPIVDGGVIVMLIIEKIKGSPINPKIQAAISYAGLALILFFFIFVTINDIAMWYKDAILWLMKKF